MSELIDLAGVRLVMLVSTRIPIPDMVTSTVSGVNDDAAIAAYRLRFVMTTIGPHKLSAATFACNSRLIVQPMADVELVA